MRRKATALLGGACILVAALSGCGGNRLGDYGAPLERTEAAVRPTIDFTKVPPLGQCDPFPLQGVVRNVGPAKYNVATYIRVGGVWWAKPTWANPDTPIGAGGAWQTWTCTGGHDQDADRVFVGVIPKSYHQPGAEGGSPADGSLADPLPRDLFNHCLAWVMCERTSKGSFRTLLFPWAKYDWAVKSGTNMGPGPNDFSDSTQSVWLDRDFRLHLRIARRAGRWSCAEVINRSHLGFGKYAWTIDSFVDRLDPNVVLGLFTWDDNPPHREIDIEFSRWAQAASKLNAQYVVQPWDRAGNRLQFHLPHVAPITCLFDWRAGGTTFEVHKGASEKGPLLKRWVYRGPDVPRPGRETPRINLWLFNGQAPANGRAVEVVISRFAYTK